MTLPLGRPFITACIGGAFGGGDVGLFDQLGHSVGAIAIGASDLSLIPLLNGSSGYGWALLGYASGLVVAHVVGFAATLLFGVSASVRADLEAQSASETGHPVAREALLDVRMPPGGAVR